MDLSKTPSPTEDEVPFEPLILSDIVPPQADNKTVQSSLIDFDIGFDLKQTSVPAVHYELAGQHDAAEVSIDANHPRDYSQIIDNVPATAPPDEAAFALKDEELEKGDLARVPEIGTNLDSKPVAETEDKDPKNGACDTSAQQPTTTTPTKKKEVTAAMEGETPASTNKTDGCCCPFSPGVFFKPEKLNPTVAEYVYWKDIKKSGICFGSSLLLLLSLKYFSFISVASYLMLAVLSVTISFRIYKNVLQAVQKSNEGHPFKEFLEMDINLSHEKLKDASEVLIHHVNSVTNKIRSLILVEDLFDTLKLVVFAWCLTYIGAWFNGMTVIILALVSAFTLPKVYETNKAQIDVYAEILRVKGKEVMDMINAKMPLGKKKKDE